MRTKKVISHYTTQIMVEQLFRQRNDSEPSILKTSVFNNDVSRECRAILIRTGDNAIANIYQTATVSKEHSKDITDSWFLQVDDCMF